MSSGFIVLAMLVRQPARQNIRRNDADGEDKTSVRMVLGVASLPLGVPVAVEVILEVEA
jgi:hypothetical protein